MKCGCRVSSSIMDLLLTLLSMGHRRLSELNTRMQFRDDLLRGFHGVAWRAVVVNWEINAFTKPRVVTMREEKRAHARRCCRSCIDCCFSHRKPSIPVVLIVCAEVP